MRFERDLFTKKAPMFLLGSIMLASCTMAETTGNGFTAEEGECLTYDAKITLAPDQDLLLAGRDMSIYKGNTTDTAVLSNENGTLVIKVDSDDEGKVSIQSGGSSVEVESNLEVDADNNSVIKYSEQGTELSITPVKKSEIIVLQVQQICTD